MTEPPTIENTVPDTLKSQLAKGLGLFWILSGILLLFCFFISNYSMVLKDFSGLDMVKIVFKDTETLRQVGDTTTFLLMVLIPIFYFGLAVFFNFNRHSINRKEASSGCMGFYYCLWNRIAALSLWDVHDWQRSC